jgi:hypothetical protein
VLFLPFKRETSSIGAVGGAIPEVDCGPVVKGVLGALSRSILKAADDNEKAG